MLPTCNLTLGRSKPLSGDFPAHHFYYVCTYIVEQVGVGSCNSGTESGDWRLETGVWSLESGEPPSRSDDANYVHVSKQASTWIGTYTVDGPLKKTPLGPVFEYERNIHQCQDAAFHQRRNKHQDRLYRAEMSTM